MAATWIDYVADHLVSILNFMGIVLHIPDAIMGLTVLAWGNSMGDLSANITMARKGLANMAMTACFAGLIFNILVGLGLGFSNLHAQTGKEENSGCTFSTHCYCFHFRGDKLCLHPSHWCHCGQGTDLFMVRVHCGGPLCSLPDCIHCSPISIRTGT